MSWMSAGFNIYGAYDLAAATLNRKIFDPAKAPAGDQDTPFGRLPAYLSYRPISISDFFFASDVGSGPVEEVEAGIQRKTRASQAAVALRFHLHAVSPFDANFTVPVLQQLGSAYRVQRGALRQRFL